VNPQQGLAAVQEIESTGRRAVALPLNVANSDSVQRCVATALEHFPRIDVLVNNAGIFQSRLGLAVDDEEFSRCLDINLTGAWRMACALIPHFRAHGAGRIVNIASVGGRRGVDFAPAYCASKAAMINLTQSLAAALGPDNINVNAICPGAVGTAMQDQIKALRSVPGAAGGAAAAVRTLTNLLTAADIGRAVAFFASAYSSAITGQALNVDCGFLKY
jgi:NAD(P)-dependent dehydrogenase (short-subunit alcohol dehydrogenase family)